MSKEQEEEGEEKQIPESSLLCCTWAIAALGEEAEEDSASRFLRAFAEEATSKIGMCTLNIKEESRRAEVLEKDWDLDLERKGRGEISDSVLFAGGLTTEREGKSTSQLASVVESHTENIEGSRTLAALPLPMSIGGGGLFAVAAAAERAGSGECAEAVLSPCRARVEREREAFLGELPTTFQEDSSAFVQLFSERWLLMLLSREIEAREAERDWPTLSSCSSNEMIVLVSSSALGVGLLPGEW